MATKQEEQKPKKRRIKWWMWILLVLIVGGLLSWKFVFAKKNGKESAKVERGEVAEELVLTGEIKAQEHAQLAFQSSGEITWMGVSEGDKVMKGQMLAKLDTVSLNAAYQQALSNLRLAEATLERVHDDVKDNDEDESFTEKETRTTAEVAKDKAYEAVIIARRNLRNAGIIAPFGGVVTNVSHPYSGINTSFTESQIEVVNPESMYFEVNADQTEVVGLSEGQEVKIMLDAYPDDELVGKISNISFAPKVNEVGTVYGVKISVESLDANKFRVGMTGDAKLVTDRRGDVLYVPPKFVNSEKGKRYLLLDGDRKVYVEVGLEGEERTEVKGEIKEGDVIYD